MSYNKDPRRAAREEEFERKFGGRADVTDQTPIEQVAERVLAAEGNSCPRGELMPKMKLSRADAGRVARKLVEAGWQIPGAWHSSKSASTRTVALTGAILAALKIGPSRKRSKS